MVDEKEPYRLYIFFYVLIHFVLGVMLLWGIYDFWKPIILEVTKLTEYSLHFEGLIETFYIIVIAIWTNIGWDVVKTAYKLESVDYILSTFANSTFVLVSAILSVGWVLQGAYELYKYEVRFDRIAYYFIPVAIVWGTVVISICLEKQVENRKSA